MKCPCCNREMEKGYLQTMQRIAWTKKIHKASLLPKEGELMLENRAFGGCNFTAYLCKACSKIVIDYSDKNITEG